VLRRLTAAGFEAALVGGCVRDLLAGAQPLDWDIATSARPEETASLFAGAVWQNRFGTVTVGEIEVTTYRSESGYVDRRRPDSVAWGRSLEDDLSRRDFTINAMAWVAVDLARRRGRLVDPFGGRTDLRDRVLRAVGDPQLRLREDALRLLRAVRFATRFGMIIDPATEAAIRQMAASIATLSGERIRDELLRFLSSPAAPPSRAFLLMEDLRLLDVVLPELAALRGIPQGKALPGDALDHSLRTADALPSSDTVLRLAGLLHDIGKATTLADGHFIGHETVGADLARRLTRRLRLGNDAVERVSHLIREHMFAYTADWTDAAVRRFIHRVGRDHLADLFALRRADNAASGASEPSSGGLAELEGRIARELAQSPLEARQMAIDGDDLIRALGLPPGPVVGRLLNDLFAAITDDPTRNRREELLALASDLLPGAREQRDTRRRGEPAE
jgi:tRNA nucleotidyltransferase (CCA-adding enzyme)